MPKYVGQYELLHDIGKGAFSKVVLGVDLNTKEEVAVKIVKRTPNADSELDATKREVAILRLLNHPNIVRLIDWLRTPRRYYIVLEHVGGGELVSRIEAAPSARLLEAEAALYFVQTLRGLAHCHANGVAHRDLKPSNLLLTSSGGVKIADFGLSRLQPDAASPDDALFHTRCGTPHYAAPEVLCGRAYSGPQADMWSCGVVLYAMVTGRLPFVHPPIGDPAREFEGLRALASSGKYRPPSDVSEGLRCVLRRLLSPDPVARPSAAELLASDAWVLSIDAAPPPPMPIPLTAAQISAGISDAIVDVAEPPRLLIQCAAGPASGGTPPTPSSALSAARTFATPAPASGDSPHSPPDRTTPLSRASPGRESAGPASGSSPMPSPSPAGALAAPQPPPPFADVGVASALASSPGGVGGGVGGLLLARRMGGQQALALRPSSVVLPPPDTPATPSGVALGVMGGAAASPSRPPPLAATPAAAPSSASPVTGPAGAPKRPVVLPPLKGPVPAGVAEYAPAGGMPLPPPAYAAPTTSVETSATASGAVSVPPTAEDAKEDGCCVV